jgi:predicted DNA-binding transcriptional regulator AlpA
LELLPQLIDLLIEIKQDIQVLKSYKPDLRKAKEVYEFLGISKGSLYEYIHKGIFKEGIHYKTENGKTVFIEEGIIGFKETYVKHAKGKRIVTKQVENFIMKLAA